MSITKIVFISICTLLIVGVIIIFGLYKPFYQTKVEKELCEQNINDESINYIYFNDSPTQSMYPTLNWSSVVEVERITNETELKIGDIISFRVPDAWGCSFTHRIINIKEDRKGVYYKTKGDNNRFSDLLKVRSGDIMFIITKIK